MDFSISNEELAKLIQNGDDGYLPQLWEQVRRIIEIKAARYLFSLGNNKYGVEVDDLIQQGYFAILKAVKYFKPDSEYKFTTFLNYTLKNAFDEACGTKTNKGFRENLIDKSLSFAMPLSSEDQTLTLEDTLEDDFDFAEMVEQSVYNQELRSTLNLAMSELSERQNQLITLYYFFGMTTTQIASLKQRNQTQISYEINNALFAMRKGKYSSQLLEFMCTTDEHFDPYKGTGYSAWKHGASVEEKFLIRMDDEHGKNS